MLKMTIFCSVQLYLIALLKLFKITLKTNTSNEHNPPTFTISDSNESGIFVIPKKNSVFLLGWTLRHYTSGQLTEGVPPRTSIFRLIPPSTL